MTHRTLKYFFGIFSAILFVGLLYRLTQLPGGMILPGFILGGMEMIGFIIAAFIVAGLAKLILNSRPFWTLLCITTSIAFIILHYFWYSPTLKIVVPKDYVGQISLVLSNVDNNILTVDSNGIGYITKWTFDRTYMKPVVVDEYGKDMNDLCVGFNPTSFWGKGAATSTEYTGEIRYLSFKIVSKNKSGQMENNRDFTNYIDKYKVIKK